MSIIGQADGGYAKFSFIIHAFWQHPNTRTCIAFYATWVLLGVAWLLLLKCHILTFNFDTVIIKDKLRWNRFWLFQKKFCFGLIIIWWLPSNNNTIKIGRDKFNNLVLCNVQIIVWNYGKPVKCQICLHYSSDVFECKQNNEFIVQLC